MTAHSDASLRVQSPDHSQKHMRRRNLWAHILDGGLYIGAVMFVAPATVLPVLFERLAAPTWLIALAPQLTMLGYLLPSILVAHIVDRMHRVKPFTVSMGLVQRLPYIVVAVAMFTLNLEEHRHILLALVAIAVFGSGILGGIGMGAWQELVHRTVEAKQRAGMFAARNTMAALLGFIIGISVERILASYTGIEGYGILFACTSIGLFMSFAAFCCIKEEPNHNRLKQERISFTQNLKDIPQIIRETPGFLLLIIVGMLGSVSVLVLPFLAIDACSKLGVGDAFVGKLLTAQMLGGIIGNIAAGTLGNRWGGRLPYALGFALLLVSYTCAVYAQSALAYQFAFVILGLAQYMSMVGHSTLALELAPENRRSTGLSVLRIGIACTIIVMSFIAAYFRDTGVSLEQQLWMVLGVGVITVLLMAKIPEPRKH